MLFGKFGPVPLAVFVAFVQIVKLCGGDDERIKDNFFPYRADIKN